MPTGPRTWNRGSIQSVRNSVDDSLARAWHINVEMCEHARRTTTCLSAQILADYFDRLEPEERREHLFSIARNTRQMSSLMEEVLVLSRVDSGKMAFEPAPLALAAFCRRLTDVKECAESKRRR